MEAKTKDSLDAGSVVLRIVTIMQFLPLALHIGRIRALDPPGLHRMCDQVRVQVLTLTPWWQRASCVSSDLFFYRAHTYRPLPFGFFHLRYRACDDNCPII